MLGRHELATIERKRLSTSMQQSFARLTSGKPGKLPPPVDDIEAILTPQQIESARSLCCIEVDRRLPSSSVSAAKTLMAAMA